MGLDKNIEKKLNKILSKTGDLSFKRRVISIVKYLDIKKGDIVLDIGCGEGFYPMILSELYNCKIYAIDHDEEILSLARTHLKGKKNIELSTGDIYKLEFKNNYFDKIICSEVIEHLEKDNDAVKETYRVLKPGGRAVFTVPNINYPLLWDPLNKIREWLDLGHFSEYNRILGGVWSWGHQRLYSPRSLLEVLEKNNFHILHIETQTKYGIPFNLLILNLGKLFYTKLPVSKNIKNSMEKFDWEKEKENKNLVSNLIDSIFGFFVLIDSFNNRELDLEDPSMTILSVVEKEDNKIINTKKIIKNKKLENSK